MSLIYPPAPIPNLVTVIPASGSALTLSAGNQIDPAFDITLTAACTISLSAVPNGRVQSIMLILRQDATAGRLATLPSGIIWSNVTPPVLNTVAGFVDVLTVWTIDGVNWFGSINILKGAAASLAITAFSGTIYGGTTVPSSGAVTPSFADTATTPNTFTVYAPASIV